MSANNHTPIATGAAANSSTINAPLGQLDAAMGDLDTLTTTAKSDIVAAVNELNTGKQNNPVSQSANQVYASPSGTAGVPGFRSLVTNDLPNSGVAAGTLTKVTVNTKGQVTAGGSLLASDISDLGSTPVDTLGAPTDVTTNNATIGHHGFMPKLANDALQFVNGIGNWVKWACGIKYNSSGAYTPRSFLNFKGAGVTVQDNAANDSVDITISGIAGGQQSLATLTDVSIVDPQLNQVPVYNNSSHLWENKNISSFIPTGHVIQDEGVNLTNRPSINLIGNGVAATDNSVTNSTDVTVTVPVKASGAEVTAGTDDAKFATPKAMADAGITATPVKASGSEVITGTNDTKFITPKAIKDAGIVPLKLISSVPHKQMWIGFPKPTVTNGCGGSSQLEMGTNKNVYDYLPFDKDAIEYAYANVPMPEDYSGGTVYAQFFWTHPATTTNFKVSWGIQAVSFSDDDTMDAGQGTAIFSNDTGGTTSDLFKSPQTSAITIAGTPAAGDLVNFRIQRKADDGTNDTLAVDAYLLGVLIWYPVA